MGSTPGAAILLLMHCAGIQKLDMSCRLANCHFEQQRRNEPRDVTMPHRSLTTCHVPLQYVRLRHVTSRPAWSQEPTSLLWGTCDAVCCQIMSENLTAVRTCSRNRCSSRSALRGIPIPGVTFAIMMHKSESNVDLADSHLACATGCLPSNSCRRNKEKTSEACVRTRLWCW